MVEPHAVCATTVVRVLESRASNLASPAVTAGNGSSLARSGWLMAMHIVLGRRRLLRVGGIVALRWWRWWRMLWSGSIPLVRAWEAIGLLLLLLLLLRVLVSGHVVSWFLRSGRWWESGVDMSWRLRGVRIRAVCGLL